MSEKTPIHAPLCGFEAMSACVRRSGKTETLDSELVGGYNPPFTPEIHQIHEYLPALPGVWKEYRSMSVTSRFAEGLNEPQRKAVLTTEGPVLVLAGAGSGKTRVITQRISHIIASCLADPQEVLAVTFTNKAAAEMRERVANLIGNDFARDVVISTFHAYCLRVLRTHAEALGYRRNFTIAGEGDTKTLIRRVIGDLDGSAHDSFSPGIFQALISQIKNTGGSLDEAVDTVAQAETGGKYGTWLPEVFAMYQSALRAANSVDFDDLQLLALQLWRENEEVLNECRRAFKYVMVDEYQDTNRVQYELVRALVGEHRNLCVVGDDDQSIYTWRGADVRNILDFEKDFPDATIITLDQNYRSTETILNAANSVIKNNEKRRAKKLWSQLGTGRPIDWIVTGNEEHEAATVVEWLNFILKQSGAKLRDFAILYRSNLQSRQFEIAFRQAGIPYVVVGGQEFYDRAEVKDVIAYLKAISNPRDEAALLRIINVPRRGVGDATLHQAHAYCMEHKVPFGKALGDLLASGGISGSPAQGVREFLGLLGTFRGKFRERKESLRDLLAQLLDAIRYKSDLEKSSKTPEHFMARWGNVEAVIRAVETYEQNRTEATLMGFLDDNSLAGDNPYASKEDRKQNAITLMTIHSAKGLEFPFVFIVGVEEGLLPHAKNASMENVDEERRLFYVALTRGRRHVTLFEALSRVVHGRERMTTTSRFLKEIPPELLKRHIRAATDMVAERVAPPKPKPKARPRGNKAPGKGGGDNQMKRSR